jgi:tRNA modification GTPase
VVDERGRAVDRGLAIAATAPHSYTGEDTLELQVHGSPVVAREVVRILLACGARYALSGEFTRRAFLNGKIDLHEAGALADLLDAQTRAAARAAAANFDKGLAREVRALRTRLGVLLEELSAALDFPDEVEAPSPARLLPPLQEAAHELQRLLRAGEAGRIVREGVAVAIVGPPNAGKSSLLNALLGEERALVSAVPGTTRDTIEESVTIDGVQVRLTDTAGIREGAGQVERAGIARARRVLSEAELALVVIDGSVPASADARRVLEATRERPRVIFFNKADRGSLGVTSAGPGTIAGSAFDSAALEALRRAIAAAAWGEGGLAEVERPHPASLDEMDAVRRALEALARAVETLECGEPVDLIAGELQTALAALGHLTREEANEAVLAAIFARFCIGK